MKNVLNTFLHFFHTVKDGISQKGSQVLMLRFFFFRRRGRVFRCVCHRLQNAFARFSLSLSMFVVVVFSSVRIPVTFHTDGFTSDGLVFDIRSINHLPARLLLSLSLSLPVSPITHIQFSSPQSLV